MHLLTALVAVVVSAAPAAGSGADAGRFPAGRAVIAGRSAAPPRRAAGKDVDAGDRGGKGRAEAVLLRANRNIAGTLCAARTQVVLRGLLCEASLPVFAMQKGSILPEARPQCARPPVVIIHFPRPPPAAPSAAAL